MEDSTLTESILKNKNDPENISEQNILVPSFIDENLESQNNQTETTNSNQQIVYPEETKWRSIWGCCVRILPTNRVYYHYWEASPGMPFFVCCLILYAFLVHVIVFVPRLSSSLKISSIVISLVFMTLFFLSYFAAACMDPGYLPYDWIKTKKTKYSWSELFEGTAIRPDQIEFGKTHKPSFSSFSSSAGRFVIRADHICGWVTNWIGKRNHKQFILMNFYGALYALSLFVFQFFADEYPMSEIITMIFVLIAAGLELVFTVLLFWTFGNNIYELCSNRTQISRHKNQQSEELGYMDAMRQVFGFGSIFCWICPAQAFGANDLDYLLEDYRIVTENNVFQ